MQTSIQECRNESIIFPINLQHWFSVKCQGLWNFFCIEIKENTIFLESLRLSNQIIASNGDRIQLFN